MLVYRYGKAAAVLVSRHSVWEDDAIACIWSALEVKSQNEVSQLCPTLSNSLRPQGL